MQKNTIITGAAGGIGLAVCEALLAQQHQVWAVDLDISPLKELATQYPQQLHCVALDVSDFDAVNTWLRPVLETHLIHELVCAAGVLQMGYAHELSPKDWQRTFAINTEGVFNLCQPLAAHMRQHRQGAIVIISSNAASTPRTNMSAYAASKAATTQFARCLALELAPLGIRVNSVSPGSTDTPMQQAMWQLGSSKETVIHGSAADFRLGIPLQKIATPLEIAQGVLFLLSDAASHICMHDLRIDGGATLDA
ncbi:2,3-dihydro-2,3-dihydroxybenzoate dehydrogenase [Paenalcaligenes hominis]|uniref:2,3-dihydro-2,3-dihydroxybenzoate dehydrogenase n=1 Tax=Paenalcaligenes hominis TaxID=643674 RepID=UPI0035231995